MTVSRVNLLIFSQSVAGVRRARRGYLDRLAEARLSYAEWPEAVAQWTALIEDMVDEADMAIMVHLAHKRCTCNLCSSPAGPSHRAVCGPATSCRE